MRSLRCKTMGSLFGTGEAYSCPGGYHQKTKWHLQHLTAWGRGTLHHEYEPLKEEGSRKGHTHRSSWKGGQSSLHPGRLPPAYRAGAEPRRGHLIWRCCGRESKKSHGRAAGTRLGPLTNKQTWEKLRRCARRSFEGNAPSVMMTWLSAVRLGGGSGSRSARNPGRARPVPGGGSGPSARNPGRGWAELGGFQMASQESWQSAA